MAPCHRYVLIQHKRHITLISAAVEDLHTLLLLVLGCAVQCNQRERYINQIKQADKDLQLALMAHIQEVPSGLHMC